MMRVEIDLLNPDDVLCDGMYGKAVINLGQDAKSLAVPAACVVEHSGRSGGVVFVVRDGIARRTEVKLGGDNGTYAEIRSGIEPDDPSSSRPERPLKTECASPSPKCAPPDPQAGRFPHDLRISVNMPVVEGKARPMDGLIRASLKNPIAVTVMVLSLVVLGGLAAYSIPIDILPVFKSPAVQTLVFYSGMPAASIEKNITARLERGVGQASGGRRLESRSIVGISIVRDYFRSNVDRSGALTEVNSYAGWEYPTMPPAHCRRSSCRMIRRASRRFAWSRSTARPRARRPFSTPGGTRSGRRSCRSPARSRPWSTAARSARS